jgi:oligopeptide transport system substrate-binding protein
MKKSFMYVIALMVLLLVAGCAPQPAAVDGPSSAQGEATTAPAAEPAAASAPATFHYAFLDEPPGIDPTISQGGTQSTIYATLYEGLVTVDEAGNIVPGAAESWEVSPDGAEYTFHLRDGLKWSDGQDLTAKDFEYAWLRALQPETASTYSWFVEMFLQNGSAYAKGEVGAEEVGVKAGR